MNRHVYAATMLEAERRGMTLAGFVESALAAAGVPIADHPRQSRAQVLAHPSHTVAPPSRATVRRQGKLRDKPRGKRPAIAVADADDADRVARSRRTPAPKNEAPIADRIADRVVRSSALKRGSVVPLPFCAICCTEISGPSHREPLGRDGGLVDVCSDCETLSPRSGKYGFAESGCAAAPCGEGNRRVGSR